MTSPLNTPSLTRISLHHPSQATTDEPGSNLGSPGGSAASSGALSPLEERSQAASVARTFQNAIKPKERPKLPLTQSAFAACNELTANSPQYAKFQAAVERVKRASPMEKDEKKAHMARTRSPVSLRKAPFVELSAEEYFEQFPCKAKAKGPAGELERLPLFNADVGASAKSRYKRPITAYEMGDSIAIFCLCGEEAIVHHFSSGITRILGVLESLERFPRKVKTQYKIYIVGGDGSRESAQLLHNIRSGLLLFFGDSGKIVETFLNKAAPSPYISVALTPKKQFLYCRHD